MDGIKELAGIMCKEDGCQKGKYKDFTCSSCDNILKYHINHAQAILAAGYRKPVPSEKLVEEIAKRIGEGMWKDDFYGEYVNEISRNTCREIARSLASLFPEMKLKVNRNMKLTNPLPLVADRKE